MSTRLPGGPLCGEGSYCLLSGYFVTYTDFFVVLLIENTRKHLGKSYMGIVPNQSIIKLYAYKEDFLSV